MTKEEDQINLIINRLENIAIETRELTQELRRLQQLPVSTVTDLPLQQQNDHPFKTGDRVIITNSYLGKRGTRGVVVSTTKNIVTLRDTQGKNHTRKSTNIQYE